MKRFIPIFIVLTFSLSVSAKQLAFTKKEMLNSYQFDYRWLDFNQKERHLTFELSKEILFKRFRGFKAYKNQIAQQTINKNVFKTWSKSPHKNTQLNLVRQQGNFVLSLTGNNNNDLQVAQTKVNKLKKEAFNKYLEKNNYHQFNMPNGNIGIKPDHTKIATLSVADFKPIKPIILQEVDIKNIRYATNYVLGLVQTIPYSTLASRVTSSGAGFNPPAKLLWENQGDCDSKVTLTATLLRSLMPRVKIALIFIDGHALLGIETKQQGNDLTVDLDNHTYILAEPTGPATMPLGQISFDSEQAILNGMYSIELLD